MSAAEIMEHFQERKWKMTTVSTFLSRMIDLALDDEHISEKEAEEIERILSKAEEKI